RLAGEPLAPRRELASARASPPRTATRSRCRVLAGSRSQRVPGRRHREAQHYRRESRSSKSRYGYPGACARPRALAGMAAAHTPSAVRAQPRPCPARTGGDRPSLDDLGGLEEHVLGDGEPESLSGLEVDDEVELARLLDGEVRGASAF